MKETADKIRQGGVWDHEDFRNVRFGSKTLQALNQRIPCIVVIEDREIWGRTARSTQAER